MTNDIWLLSNAVDHVDRRGFQLQVFESPALQMAEATFPLLSFLRPVSRLAACQLGLLTHRGEQLWDLGDHDRSAEHPRVVIVGHRCSCCTALTR